MSAEVTSKCNQVSSYGNQVASDGNKPAQENSEAELISNSVVIVDNPAINVCNVTPDGIIDWTCINKEQILTDVIFESNAKVSGGQLAGTIDNQGFISQVTIQPDTILNESPLEVMVLE